MINAKIFKKNWLIYRSKVQQGQWGLPKAKVVFLAPVLLGGCKVSGCIFVSLSCADVLPEASASRH